MKPGRLEGGAVRVFLPVFSMAVAITLARADIRGSGSYQIVTDALDSGGGHSGSQDYTQVASIGLITGISTASPGETINKAGYIGQLADAVALGMSAASSSVPEGQTVQLSATVSMDDGTYGGAEAVMWSVASGPVGGITGSGLASASIVYQDSPAVIRGAAGGIVGFLDLNVINTNIDNFGSYAGDGIDDAWQVQYFGIGNPLAAALLDPDSDGQTNRFEYIARVDPTDAFSRFRQAVDLVPGQPSKKKLVFSPVMPGREYTVQYSGDLVFWQPLAGFTQADILPERSVTDNSAAPDKRFYRVIIKKE